MNGTTLRQSVYHQKMLDKGFKKRAFYVSQETIDYLTKYKVEKNLENLHDAFNQLINELSKANVKGEGV